MLMHGEFVHTDCYTYIKNRKSESVNFLCVDLPYGYNFMGKDCNRSFRW